MCDINKLTTQDDCRTVMKRARPEATTRSILRPFGATASWLEIRMMMQAIPLISDVYRPPPYEQLLSEKKNWNTVASRTPEEIKNKRVVQSLVEWTRSKTRDERIQLAG